MESGHNSIYPQNFKGTTTENADTWQRHSNNYCAYKGYDKPKTKALFRIVLIDSAALWFDSLTADVQNDWGQLKAAFLARHTTPEFMKYKHANGLFNCKQDTKSVDDFCAYMQIG